MFLYLCCLKRNVFQASNLSGIFLFLTTNCSLFCHVFIHFIFGLWLYWTTFLPAISNFLYFVNWQRKYMLSSPSYGDLPAFLFIHHFEYNPFSSQKNILVKPLTFPSIWINCFSALLYGWYSGNCFHPRVVALFFFELGLLAI